MHAAFQGGFTIDIEGNFPAENVVRVHIDPAGQTKKIALRIPTWFKRTLVECEGESWQPEAGCFFVNVTRDTVLTVTFDFTPYIEAGDEDYAGKSSVYGFDVSENPSFFADELPAIRVDELRRLKPLHQEDGSIHLTLSNGMVLKDFYHLGTSGCEYPHGFLCIDVLRK